MPDIASSNLQVPAELEDAGNHVRTISTALSAELEMLKRELAPLADTWKGEANTYFTGLEQEWNLAAAGLWGDGSGSTGLLPFIARALDTIYTNYATAETSNMTTWRRGA